MIEKLKAQSFKPYYISEVIRGWNIGRARELIPPACFDVNGTLWFHEHKCKINPPVSHSLRN